MYHRIIIVCLLSLFLALAVRESGRGGGRRGGQPRGAFRGRGRGGGAPPQRGGGGRGGASSRSRTPYDRTEQPQSTQNHDLPTEAAGESLTWQQEVSARRTGANFNFTYCLLHEGFDNWDHVFNGISPIANLIAQNFAQIASSAATQADTGQIDDPQETALDFDQLFSQNTMLTSTLESNPPRDPNQDEAGPSSK